MLIRLIIIFFLCCSGAYAVCPISTVQPAKEIKAEIEKQLQPIMDYVFFSQTPTGFVISFNSNIIFDESNELNLTGKLMLVQMAQIIKNSGRLRFQPRGQLKPGGCPRLHGFFILSKKCVKIMSCFCQNIIR